MSTPSQSRKYVLKRLGAAFPDPGGDQDVLDVHERLRDAPDDTRSMALKLMSGLTYAEVGLRFDMSKQAVHQRLKSAGLTTTQLRSLLYSRRRQCNTLALDREVYRYRHPYRTHNRCRAWEVQAVLLWYQRRRHPHFNSYSHALAHLGESVPEMPPDCVEQSVRAFECFNGAVAFYDGTWRLLTDKLGWRPGMSLDGIDGVLALLPPSALVVPSFSERDIDEILRDS